MTRTKSLLVVGLVLASVGMAVSSGAGSISRTDYLSMDRAASLPGVVLPPGNYAFEVLEGHVDLVRVSDRATGRVLYTGFTDIVRRPAGVTIPLAFGEAPKGQPLPIRVWFPQGLERGLAFRP